MKGFDEPGNICRVRTLRAVNSSFATWKLSLKVTLSCLSSISERATTAFYTAVALGLTSGSRSVSTKHPLSAFLGPVTYSEENILYEALLGPLGNTGHIEAGSPSGGDNGGLGNVVGVAAHHAKIGVGGNHRLHRRSNGRGTARSPGRVGDIVHPLAQWLRAAWWKNTGLVSLTSYSCH